MKTHAVKGIATVLALFVGLSVPLSQSLAIQTDAFPDDQRIVLKKDDIAIYQDAREALNSAIHAFLTTTKSALKAPTSSDSKDLKKSLATIRTHAEIIRVLAKSAGNKAGMSIADKLIINDDILGRKSAIEATAKKLADLQRQLNDIEPSIEK